MEITQAPRTEEINRTVIEIASSQSNEKSRDKRNVVSVIYSITVFSTSFIFATTNVPKAFTLVADTNLLCLPGGYTIC